MELFTGLIDDAVLRADSARSVAVAASGHHGLRSAHPSVLGSLLVEDHRLLELDREAAAGTAVTVLNTSGAGGLTALARRTVRNLRLIAVDAPLRDPGDPAGAVARIAAAARDLDPAIAVNVVLPPDGSADRLAADIEAEGMFAVIEDRSDRSELAARLSALVEADLPFSVDGVGSASCLLSVLLMVDALIEGADPDTAAGSVGDHPDSTAMIAGWDAGRAPRCRRRLRSVRTPDPAGMLDELAARNLISPGTGPR